MSNVPIFIKKLNFRI